VRRKHANSPMVGVTQGLTKLDGTARAWDQWWPCARAPRLLPDSLRGHRRIDATPLPFDAQTTTDSLFNPAVDITPSTYTARMGFSALRSLPSPAKSMVSCVLKRKLMAWRGGAILHEVVAVKSAREKSRGATLYVTLEPCNHTGRTGPCAGSDYGRNSSAWWPPSMIQSPKGRGASERFARRGLLPGCWRKKPAGCGYEPFAVDSPGKRRW